MDNHLHSISKFTEYFKRHLDEIATISVPSKSLRQKILYVSIIDALSKSIYPNGKNSRQRFTLFIEQFSNWSDCQRVSLLHLVEALRKSPEPIFQELREYAVTKYSTFNMGQGNLPSISVDPPMTEVKSKWPKNYEFKFPCGVELASIRHLDLFYSFRNSLVHELRTPGRGFEVKDDSNPYYLHVMEADAEYEQLFASTQLVYPVSFCRKLCDDLLNNLKKYLEVNNLDPYESYNFGTYWIENLND